MLGLKITECRRYGGSIREHPLGPQGLPRQLRFHQHAGGSAAATILLRVACEHRQVVRILGDVDGDGLASLIGR